MAVGSMLLLNCFEDGQHGVRVGRKTISLTVGVRFNRPIGRKEK